MLYTKERRSITASGRHGNDVGAQFSRCLGRIKAGSGGDTFSLSGSFDVAARNLLDFVLVSRLPRLV